MSKNIAYAFLGPFPKGNVSTVRILSYCKEIVKSGYQITVYILAPTNDAKINKDKEGIYDGIKYIYLSKVTWNHEEVSMFIKYYYYFIGIFRFVGILMSKKYDCVISYHNEVLFNFLASITCKLLRVPLILDITEYPNGFLGLPRFKKCIVQYGLKRYDGIITISNELVNFYSNVINKKVFKLPITIDSDRYNLLVKEPSEREDVISCVFGVHNRDGLINTINVYKKYFNYCKTNNIKEFELQLIGDFDRICTLHKDVNDYLESIKEEVFFKYIKVIGPVDNELFPEKICKSKILINTPVSFSSGGFPTKLGEYLLSGVPVIYTRAGEVGEVLNDKVESYLFDPLELDDIALCILFIQENYEVASKVGIEGRRLALDVFNAKKYINDLLNYCYNANKR